MVALWLCSGRYFDLYPKASDIPLAPNPRHAKGMPDVAYSVSQGIRVFKDCAAVHEDVNRCYNDIEYAYSDKCVWVDGPRKVFAQNVKRAYFACISYVDAQIGRIIAALKQEGLYDSTVISFNGESPVVSSERDGCLIKLQLWVQQVTTATRYRLFYYQQRIIAAILMARTIFCGGLQLQPERSLCVNVLHTATEKCYVLLRNS